MQLSSPIKPTRTMAVSVLCGDTTVYSDPLFRSLFGDAPPALPAESERGHIITGSVSTLLFCRKLVLDGTAYTVYLALPVEPDEAQDPARLASLCEEHAPAFFARLTRLFEGEGTPHPAPTVPILYFFRMLTEQICDGLYAPLTVEVAGVVENGSACADRAVLSYAIGAGPVCPFACRAKHAYRPPVG